MGLLSKLGLVEEQIEEEIRDVESVKEETIDQVPVEVPQGTPAPKMRFAQSEQPVQSQGSIVGEISNEVYDKLSEAIERENLDGNDFLEFMQALQNLSSLTVGESDKFNMVFTTLSTSAGGMTKEFLIESIAHYKKVLKKEQATFSGEMENATLELVDSSLSEAERLINVANVKAEEIKQLQEDILTINEQAASLSNSADESKFKIAKKGADFNVTLAQLEGQLDNYETKINNYIK